MWNMRFLAENVGCPYVFPSICEVYGRYLKEGFLNWLLHVGGRRSTTDEQCNYGEVITKKLTLISAPLQRQLSGKLDPSQIHHSATTRTGTLAVFLQRTNKI